MRSLSANLLSAQRMAPLINYVNHKGDPAIRCRLFRKRGGVNLFQWSRYAQLAFEEYDVSTSDASPVYAVNWVAQTFTPRYPHSIDRISLKLRRIGSPGTGTISIKATDGSGHPTGADLTSASVDGNSLPTTALGEWCTFNLTPYSLTRGTKYAIVLSFPSGDVSNYVACFWVSPSSTYARGNADLSFNGGSSWSSVSTSDFLFYEWDSTFSEYTEPTGTDNQHAAAMPSDGSLIRFMIDPADNKLYFQRVTSPDEDSDYHSWTYWGEQARTCALAAYGTSVWAFRANGTDPMIYCRESHDCGATWGNWQSLHGFLGSPPYYLAACARNNQHPLVLFSIEDTIYRSRGEIPSLDWSSPSGFNDPSGNWQNESNAYDGDTGTYAYQSSVTRDSWSDFIELTYTECELAKIRYYISAPSAASADIDVDYYRSSSWHDLYSGSASLNAWAELTLSAPVDSTALRIRIKPDSNSDVRLHEAQILTATTWGDFSEWTNSLSTITGLAVTYSGDWNVVVTGVDGDSQDGVWTCLLGNGYSAAPDTWTALKELLVRDSTSDYQYQFPALGKSDVFRTFVVEKYTATTTQKRLNFSYSPASADFISNHWLEPVPFRYSCDYGLAFCYSASGVWLTSPTGVWYSDISVAEYDVSSDVVEVKFRDRADLYRSKMTIVLDNTGGKYSGFDKLGWEVKLGLGYNIGGSAEYSDLPSTWITGWKFVSPPWFWLHHIYPQGVMGTLQIETEGMWDLLNRWKTRRTISWAEDDSNLYQMLSFILSRVGLEFATWSSSTAITSFKPAFDIPEGYNGKWAVKKILSWVEDVLVQRGHYAYLVHPTGSETSGGAYQEGEVFNSNGLDVWHSLDYNAIVPSSITVKSYDELTTYEEGVDYQMEYDTGRIVCLSTGSIPAATNLKAWYYYYYNYNTTYGAAHLLYHGDYGTALFDPNRAQVWGDTVMEEGYDFDQIEQVFDRLSRVTKPDYPNADRAAERVEAELRKGEVLDGAPGWIIVTTNCGQEVWDVVSVSDTISGIVDQKYRILWIYTHYNKRNRTYTQRMGLGRV